MKQLNRNVSPAIRGAAYYAVFYAIIGSYFAYVNVAYIQRGLSGVQIGTFGLIGSLLALVAGPLLTGLADRRGWHKQVLIFSNLAYGITLVGIYFAPTFRWMLPIVAMNAVLETPFRPISDSLVVRMANKHHLKFGQMRVWGSIGFTVACVFAGTIWDVIGLDYLFLVTGILFGLRSLSVLLLEAPNHTMKEDGSPTKTFAGLKSLLLPFKDRYFVLFLIGTFFWGWNLGYYIYSSIYMDQLGGSNLMVGLMIALPAVVEMPSLLIADRLADRFGLLPVYMAGIFEFSLVMVAVMFVKTPVVLVILNGFRGIGYGLYISVGVRFVDKRASKDQKGLYQSLYNVVLFTISTLVFMPFLGYLFDYHGIQWVFTATALAGGIAIVIFGYLHLLLLKNEKLKQFASE